MTALVPSLTACLANSPGNKRRTAVATGDSRAFVVVSQTGGFRSNTLENVVDERVHDAHGFTRDSSVWVDLLQNLEDVDGIRFLPLLSVLLSVLRDILLSLAGFICCLSTSFRCHCNSQDALLSTNEIKLNQVVKSAQFIKDFFL